METREGRRGGSLKGLLIAVFAAAQVLALLALYGPFGHDPDSYALLAVAALFLLIPAGVLIALLRTTSHRALARSYILLCANALVFLIYIALSFGGV